MNRSPWAWIGACGLALAVLLPAQAHQVQDHQARLSKINAKEVSLQLALDPATVLHRVVAPSQPFSEFVSWAAQLKGAEFQAIFSKMQKSMAKGVRLVGPDGSALVLSGWEWPTAQQWQDRLKAQVILSQVNTQDDTHLPQVKVAFTAKNARPVTHLQVRLPDFTWPILVVSEPSDKFWLNEQMPVAVVQLF